MRSLDAIQVKPLIFRVSIFVILVFLVFLTYWGGSLIGRRLHSRSTEETLSQREHWTSTFLDSTVVLKLKNRIPNYHFQGLRGDFVDLQSLVSDTTVIVVAEADCAACHDEIIELNEKYHAMDQSINAVVIFFGNPLDMTRFQREHDIAIPLLYDADGEYTEHIEISVYPTNLVVDHDLTLLQVIPATLTESDFIKWFSIK